MSNHRKIKLIWDFRGAAAKNTAEHHEKHLKEFITIEQMELNITGCQHMSDMHSLAFMVVNENQMTIIRDTLKPHRAEVYQS